MDKSLIVKKLKPKGKPRKEAETVIDSDGEENVDLESVGDDLKIPELSKYNPDIYALDSFAVVIGKRGYGKSIWIRWHLSHFNECYKQVYVFTKTKHNYFWQQHCPDSYIYPGWDPLVGQTIIDEAKADYNAMLDGDKEIKKCPFRLVILDDVIQDDISRDKVLTDLVFAGRHYHIGVIAAIQDVKGFGPKVRGNSDVIVSTYQTQKRTLDSLFEDYAAFFGKKGKDMFYGVMRKYTKDYGVLVIDQTKARYQFGAMFYYDKAEVDTRPYFLGWAQQWREGGDDWRAQIKRAKNKLSVDREEMQMYVKKKIAGMKRKDNSRFKMLSDTDDMDNIQLKSNALVLAPDSVRQGIDKEVKRKYGIQDNIVESIEQRIDTLLSNRYTPGTAT